MDGLLRRFLIPEVWITFGATLQLGLVAWSRRPGTWFWAAAPGAVIVGLLAAWPTVHEYGWGWEIGIAFVLSLVAAVLAGTSPGRMDDAVVLGITTAFWLTFVSSARHWLWAVPFALIPSLLAAVSASGAVRLPDGTRIFLYVSAVGALVALGLARFPHVDFDALSAPGREWLLVLAGTWLGAHLAMLVYNGASLLMLLPFADEDTPWKKRLAQIRDYLRLLGRNYAAEPPSYARILAVIGAQAALFALSRSWSSGPRALAGQACLSIALFASVIGTGPTREEDAPERLPTSGDIKRAERRSRN